MIIYGENPEKRGMFFGEQSAFTRGDSGRDVFTALQAPAPRRFLVETPYMLMAEDARSGSFDSPSLVPRSGIAQDDSS
ncbi:MAG TPA: hypothetical protein VF532_10145 [Candidatus Angelobacter sp.]